MEVCGALGDGEDDWVVLWEEGGGAGAGGGTYFVAGVVEDDGGLEEWCAVGLSIGRRDFEKETGLP